MTKKTKTTTVPRDKYNNLKRKTGEWYSKAQDLLKTNKNLLKANEELLKLNSELEDKLETGVDIDTDMVEELENTNKVHRKEIRALKRSLREQKEKYETRIASLERDALLKDGKIQQLNEAKEDLRERYKELKADYREQQRWTRGDRGDK